VASRFVALWGTFVFFWIAPATVAGWIPWTITRWQMHPPLLGLSVGRWLGLALVGLGAVGVVECFARFATKGLGTPAPILPTEFLVISGLYQHVRNPMYLAVVTAIAGQALVLGSIVLVQYAVLVWLFFFAFVLLYEEPSLRRRFGSSYEDYRAKVPRWWPRLTPWHGTGTRNQS
jgi:protein-S-isoprenylcysteine O-methyltransferase Ste14